MKRQSASEPQTLDELVATIADLLKDESWEAITAAAQHIGLVITEAWQRQHPPQGHWPHPRHRGHVRPGTDHADPRGVSKTYRGERCRTLRRSGPSSSTRW
jgi:hypothetical protein